MNPRNLLQLPSTARYRFGKQCTPLLDSAARKARLLNASRMQEAQQRSRTVSAAHHEGLLNSVQDPALVSRVQVGDYGAAVSVLPVCVGDHWHRFPSSFHLPDPRMRLQLVKSSFHGHLPRPFNDAEVGNHPELPLSPHTPRMTDLCSGKIPDYEF